MITFLGAQPLLPICFAAVLLTGLATALAWAPMRRDEQLRRQLAQIRDRYGVAGGAEAARAQARLMEAVTGTVGRLLIRSGFLSPRTIASLENTLAAAGMRGNRALPAFVGAKVLLLALFPALAWLAADRLGIGGTWGRVLLAAAAVAGLLGPDLALRLVRRRYIAALERAMPDALDLLVICAEAGLALEQGMERVAREIAANSPPCAIELMQTHNELQIFPDGRTALVNLGRRTGLVNLQRLAGTLSQALQYGTPLSQALRSLATDLRTEAFTRFEARAARLPVLMTLPMILFILPCVFLIVAGPALLAVLATLRHQ